jgi:hypothetical protein
MLSFEGQYRLIGPQLLLAATVRGRHGRATAMPLHLDAASTFCGCHLRIRHSAGHRRHKRPDQQQHQCSELARAHHCTIRILHRSGRVSCLRERLLYVIWIGFGWPKLPGFTIVVFPIFGSKEVCVWSTISTSTRTHPGEVTPVLHTLTETLAMTD